MSLFSFFKKKQPQTPPQVVLPDLPALNAWGIFYQQSQFNLYSRFAGSLPGDNADSIYLKSYPELPQLERMLFGDWLYIAFQGIFLQRWDAPDGSTTSLLFIDTESLTVKEIKTDIISKNWSTYLQNNALVFTFNGATKEVVTITVADTK